MAGIDKIYNSTDKYDEFYNWCNINKPQAICYFYPRNGYEDNSDRPITNFPMWMDDWMLQNSRKLQDHNLQWVAQRIREQYGLDKTQDCIEVSEEDADDLLTMETTCEFCKKIFEFPYSEEPHMDYKKDKDDYEYSYERIHCPYCDEHTRLNFVGFK